MAFTLIQNRLVSGKGVLKVPSNQLTNRSYSLFLQVVRRPKQEYLNLNYNPSKSRYANLLFLKDDYVVKEYALEYLKARINEEPDKCGQTLIAVKCAYQGLLQSFVNQNLALGLTVTGVTNSITGYTILSLPWNEIRIVCYADTAVQMRLYAEPYAACDNNYISPSSGAPNPPEPTIFSPGTPISASNGLSPPYDYASNDGGNTSPYPGDTIPPLTNCTTVTINIRANWLINGQNTVYTSAVTGKAPVVNVEIDEVASGGSSVFVTDATGANNTCVPGTRRRVDRAVGTLSSLTYTVTI